MLFRGTGATFAIPVFFFPRLVGFAPLPASFFFFSPIPSSKSHNLNGPFRRRRPILSSYSPPLPSSTGPLLLCPTATHGPILCGPPRLVSFSPSDSGPGSFVPLGPGSLVVTLPRSRGGPSAHVDFLSLVRARTRSWVRGIHGPAPSLRVTRSRQRKKKEEEEAVPAAPAAAPTAAL